jgi:O-antigen/teichoic acid export membrane protein
MLPLSVLVLGLMQIFESYSNRENFYKQMASAKIVSAGSTALMQITTKSFFSMDGLVISKVFSDLVGVLLLLKHHIKKQTLQLKFMSKRRVLANAKRHDHFPKFQTGTSLINYISQYLPIYLFPIFYSSEVAGFYALSFRMLMIPTTIMGSSVRSVYYQKASNMFSAGKKIYPLYKKTTLGLIKIYLLPLLVIAIFGKEIFSLIFSDKWLISGSISQIMIFLSFFAFINIPSVMTFNILKLQKLQLKLQVLQFVSRISAISIGYYLFNSYMISILLYALVAIGNNIFLIYYINRRLKSF